MRSVALALAVAALVLVLPAPAGAATVPQAPLAGVTGSSGGGMLAARFGTRLRARPTYRPSSRLRPRSGVRGRRLYRPPRIGHFFGNMLRFLGIAYLVHALFGWGGGGGSPLGLLLVLGVVAWLLTRRARRRPYAPARW